MTVLGKLGLLPILAPRSCATYCAAIKLLYSAILRARRAKLKIAIWHSSSSSSSSYSYSSSFFSRPSAVVSYLLTLVYT